MIVDRFAPLHDLFLAKNNGVQQAAFISLKYNVENRALVLMVRIRLGRRCASFWLIFRFNN